MLASAGCRTAKVKVVEPGQEPGEDEARLEAVRDALGPDGLVRIDANGGWSVDEAVARIPVLERAAGGLEYVEQPVASVEDLALVRRRVSVPIAADESIRRVADPYRVRDLEAADIAVLKVQPLGGVRACLRIAEDIGLPVVVSSAVESSIGIAAGVALAAALPELPHACGLATVQLLTGDVVADPLLPVDGALPVRRPAVDLVPAGGAGRLARTGGALATPDGRGRGRAAGSSAVTASTLLATWLVDQLVERGTDRRRALPRVAQRTAVLRAGCRRAGHGCTPGSTSAPPPSSPSGWPRDRAGRSRS